LLVAESGDTSGIIVDNVSTAAQASSIYFTTLGNTTCGTAFREAGARLN